jgi:hypothetical protein
MEAVRCACNRCSKVGRWVSCPGGCERRWWVVGYHQGGTRVYGEGLDGCCKGCGEFVFNDGNGGFRLMTTEDLVDADF